MTYTGLALGRPAFLTTGKQAPEEFEAALASPGTAARDHVHATAKRRTVVHTAAPFGESRGMSSTCHVRSNAYVQTDLMPLASDERSSFANLENILPALKCKGMSV